jgi:uncharacterized membrane protein YedE/YeeE
VNALVALASGLLFGVGLALSGMTQPQKVLNFLDVTGTWDPSLALVMGGALAVSAVGHQLARSRRAPLLAPQFPQPATAGIDRSLVLGSSLFGVGWGLVGLCPGPALANLAQPATSTLVFVASMGVGMALFRLGSRSGAMPGPGAAIATVGMIASLGVLLR